MVTMEKGIITFTVFTFLLFTISTATIASDPVHLPGSDSEPSTVAGSDVPLPVLPTEKPLDLTAANEKLPESEQTQTFNLPFESNVIFSLRHPIQRHSFDRSTRIPLRFVRRHPCRKFKKMFPIPTKRSYGNDMIVSDKAVTAELETIGDQVPMKWLEFKHKYGHRHHHYQKKFEFDEEKLKLKVKKRENKGGFMRRIRKFLKHTFD